MFSLFMKDYRRNCFINKDRTKTMHVVLIGGQFRHLVHAVLSCDTSSKQHELIESMKTDGKCTFFS